MLADELVTRRRLGPEACPRVARISLGVDGDLALPHEGPEGLVRALDALPVFAPEFLDDIGRAHAARRDAAGEVRADMQPFQVAAEPAPHQYGRLQDRWQKLAFLDWDQKVFHRFIPS